MPKQSHKAYIDVRGPWPTLVHGQAALTLRGCDRSITVEEAVKHLLGEDINTNREEAITTDLNLDIATE